MRLDKDVWAGLFFMGLAGLGLWIGADYQFGTPARMGAGFLPKLLCWILLAIGAMTTLIGFVRRGEPMEAWAWGQMVAILDAVLLFGAALEPVGLEMAIMGAVLLAGTATPSPNRFEHYCLVVGGLLLSYFLLPGATAKLASVMGLSGTSVALPGIAGLNIVALAILGLASLALLLAVVSHVRHVPFAIVKEQVVGGVVLAVLCIIIFVDALGLTMKSLFVLDGWIAVKRVTLQPLVQLIRAAMGY